ncbi:MAG: substrate-binding domain-containing protein [Clostridia bacterium]|nr:substrate-binding domain-containing protein [Clostridia bacterium]
MRKVGSLVLILALLVSLVGCGGSTQNSDNNQAAPTPQQSEAANAKMQEMEDILMAQLQPLPETNTGDKIGILVITLTNPFWVGMKEAYEAAGQELGVEVEVMAAPTENDSKSQLETLQAMTAKDYKALIISPIEPFNLVPGIVQANNKGIKVVNLGPGVDTAAVANAGGKIDGRICVDFEEQGKLAAEYIIEKMGSEGGKVAIIQGIPGAGQSEGRTQGAKKAFESAPNVELVSIQPANWDRNTAYNTATNLIQAHPDLKGIFCCNDVMALAAADALEAAGQREGKIIFGVDFIGEAAEAMKSGKLDGSIAYSSTVYAKAAVLLALKTIQEQEVPETVFSPLAVVTKENIDQYEGWK